MRRSCNTPVARYWEDDQGESLARAGRENPSMRMHDARSALSRKTGAKLAWSWIGPAISVVMIAGALFILWGLLRDVDIDKVLAAIMATPPHAILSACLFVGVGYLTLTLYDYFALRTIGRREVPYRTAAFASFTSYTIGHNLGATVFTGGLVRLRIYSAWGLGIVDVAKMAFVTGLTFWLGNVAVLGVALAYAPDAATAVTQLPSWINRLLGIAALATIGAYVVWLLPRARAIGRDSWQVTLPDARLTFVQIGIGVLDFAAGSLAFYMLMPVVPVTDFVVVAVVFVSATLLGFISHAPGSLGIFDAATLIALPHFQTEQLLASLLIFRVLYFVAPFVIAVLMLGTRELWLARRTRVLARKPQS
jgi:glycosyltransferase 2 family protein